MVCDIEGCAAEVAAAALEAGQAALWESAPAPPQCAYVADGGADSIGVSLRHIALASGFVLGAVAAALLFHFVLTPWWIHLYVPAGSAAHVGKAEVDVQLSDVAVGFHDIEEDSPPSPVVLGAQMPPPPIWGQCDTSADSKANELEDAGTPKSNMDPESLALEGFVEARARCRAHVVLFLITGFVTTLCRLILIVAIAPALALTLLAILALCIWQISTLARIACSPLLVSNAGSTCGSFAGDLRIYAGITFMCEFLVLCLAIGVLNSNPGIMPEGPVGRGAVAAEPHSFGFFVLEQATVSFVLVRLYVAWVALGLHKLRRDITFAILPESPKSRGQSLKLPEDAAPQSQTILVSPWRPRSGSPTHETAHAAARRRARFHAFLVVLVALVFVLAAAGVGIWRATRSSERLQSSCRTAARGLDFCVRTDYIGLSIETNSMDECCALCDVTAGCSAWSFVENSAGRRGRCWRMHFAEAPCDEHPDHFSCRCHTGAERFGGYKIQ